MTRLAPRPAAQWDEGTRSMLRGRLARADQYLEPGARVPNVLGLLAHHERLASAWLAWNAVLLEEGSLEPRLRELLVLRVAHRAGSEYEWLQHLRIGARAGLTPRQLDDVRTGPAAPGWTAHERLLLTAADELLDHRMISDRTWAALVTELDVKQVLELMFVTGSYLCLATVFNSVALEPDPEDET